jgi:hypothetical protein
MVRFLGALIMAGAGTMLGYFWLAFDISVPTPIPPPPGFNPYYYSPGRAVNIGLMNDRLVGTLVTAAAGLAGLILLVNVKVRPRPGWEKAPAPQPPAGFNYDLSFAMHYKPRPAGGPPMLRPEWTHAVSHLANLSAYQPEQVDWAYTMGVDPKNFVLFVAFIEAYRSWQFSGGMVRAG